MAYEILVSAQGPFVLGFGAKGLTIWARINYICKLGLGNIDCKQNYSIDANDI